MLDAPGPPADPAGLARSAAEELLARTGVPRFDVLVVLGSGWRPAAEELGEPEVELPVVELPGFVAPTAAGHGGTACSMLVGGKRLLVLLGRPHRYEGRSPAQVAHPVRTACAAGVSTVLLTNAAGGIRAGLRVGEPVLISDQLNLTAASPLVGATFVDMVDAYAPRLRALARQVDPSLAEGVYAGVLGPQFETPAEIRMLRILGADLVGMSTVLETIAARAEGVQVFGLSLVTNLAAGITGEPLDHEEVLEAGLRSARRTGGLLRELVSHL